MSSSWPLPVVAVPPATCGAVLWRMQGVPRVTIVVKASFQLVHEKRAEIVGAPEIAREDRMRPGGESLEQAAEIAPFLPGVGILLHGHACAPAGRTATAVTARLALHRDRWIFNKVLHVYGDRSPEAPNPRPFQAIPLVYERAYGGRDVPANPAGSGAAGPLLPNVVDSSDPMRPGGFGPIAKQWPLRRKLLAGGREPDPAALELDSSFELRWFHAAPADQQIDFLRGDEWIFLESMHPQFPWIRSGLPSARGLGRFHRIGVNGADQGQTVDLVADSLIIDADRLLCSVLWRGHFACGPNDSPANLAVVGGVEMPGRPVVWPPPETWAPVVQERPTGVELVADEERTAEIRPADLLALRRATPFARREPGKPHAPAAVKLSATPWGNEPIKPAPQPIDNLAVTQSAVHLTGPSWPMHTVDLISPFAEGTSDAPRIPLPQGPVLPFAPAPAADSPPASEPPRVPSLDKPPFLFVDAPPAIVPVKEPAEALPPSARPPELAYEPPQTESDEPEELLEDEPEEILDVEPDPISAPAAAGVELPEPEAKGLRAVVSARLKKGEPFHDLELAGTELDGVDFGGASLQRRNLASSSLVGCNFKGARLSGADLSGADLSGAILTGADLAGADLGRATLDRAQLEGAILTGANLSSAKAQGANFEGASMEGADVRKARLSEATLDGANLSRIVGGGVDFSRSSLARANLSGANLRAAKLRQARLAGATIDGADLRDADLTGAHVYGTDLGSAKTGGAILRDLVETPPSTKS